MFISVVTTGLWMLAFLGLCDICFFQDEFITGGWLASNEILIFIALFTLITLIKYKISKWFLEDEENKNKTKSLFILAIVFFIIINLLYVIVPKIFEIPNWTITDFDNNVREVISFMFLPKYTVEINILKLTVFDLLYSLFLISWVKNLEDKKTGVIAYVAERMIKNLIRLSPIFIFFIFLFTISNKYLKIGEIQAFGYVLISILIVIFIIKNYLIIKACRRKEKEEYGKENLIVVITPVNYKFSFFDHIISPLNIFYKYDNKNLIKTIIVDGKDYTFITYDVLRYKLIDMKKFKNVAYYINLVGNFEEIIDTNSEFSNKVREIIKENNNFMICYPKISNFIFVSKFAGELKKKYRFRFTREKDIKKILDIVTLDESIDGFKDNIKNTIDYIRNKELNNYLEINKKEIENKNLYLKYIYEPLNSEEEDKKAEKVYKKIAEEKNRYLKYGLNVCLESFNYIECFYTLLKMSEYITHYMALKHIIINPDGVSKDRVREGTLSAWRECIPINPIYTKQDKKEEDGLVSSEMLINSLIKINEKIKEIENKDEKVKVKEKNEYAFKEDVCKSIAEIRNKIVAHGVVTIEIAKELLEDLFNVTYTLIRKFEEESVSIEEDEMIKNVFEEDVYAIYKKEDDMFLYSNTVVKREGKKKVDLYKECLNYETGDHQIIDKKLYLQTDYIYNVNAIETMLSKWVEK